VTFFCAAKRKSPKKRPPWLAGPAGCPVLLGGSQGGYGNGPKLSKLEIHKTRESIDLAGLI
jgi:hypothetical protein